MGFAYKFVLIMAISGTANCMIDIAKDTKETRKEIRSNDRDEKLFNVFTVVRFPNDPCAGSDSRNGTCYTEAECSSRSGSNSGSCAQGFGVCCVFVAGCGQSVAENCTYFEYTGTDAGACSLEICPCSSGICQMRLDFSTFVITGPSTATRTQGKEINGVIGDIANGKEFSYQSQCLTDTFTVSGQNTGLNSPPTICGTNTGQHMYAEMDANNCNSLDFARGSAGIDATVPASRSWSIKVTQIDCQSELRAPQGCTQYYYGGTAGSVETYNYNSGTGLHLANQNQNICVRQERGYCRICWYAADPTDFDVSGLSNLAVGAAGQAAMCCSYGADGKGVNGYDCLIIPGAKWKTSSADFKNNAGAAVVNIDRFCGHSEGLVGTKTGADGVTGTVCTKTEPFSIQFITDQFEMAVANGESAGDTVVANLKTGSGFMLNYFLNNNNC